MKSGIGLIVREAQERYLERLLPPRDAIAREIEELAAAEDVPIADPEVARLLEIMARSTRARTIVEVGTAIGYGALFLARGAPEARVLTIDRDAERLATARRFLEKAGVAERVELIEDDALAALTRITGPIDLAWVDGEKKEYRRYLDLLLPQMSVGGTLLFDNLLWKGRVAEPPEEEEDDEATDALFAFNGYLMRHPQLAAVILPFGDGLGVATKTKPLISELGGPF
ncbi:MAG TPA: O-methyltransferase [Thermoanaerobaculia bacterium]|nr:O-methyltransferase [Thermoanaerobaculia bacterium]